MSSWIATELAEQEMGDSRLNKRIAKLMENLCGDASLSIPCANTCWAETLAAYRFFDNDRATFNSIMSGHRASTLKRIQAEPVVLIPQDTTFLSFATDDKSKQMGTLRTQNANQQRLHASIAITPNRINLGAAPKAPPSLIKATRMLAELGGFLGRKGDGEPGVKTIWQGYNKLLHYVEAADAFGV